MLRSREMYAACAALLALASCIASDGAEDPGDSVDPADTTSALERATQRDAFALTEGGVLRGVQADGVRAFRGVPYAAPPVGARRWKPPERAAPWFGVRDATQFAPHCAQVPGPFGQASTAEDCLYLNVYAPAHHGFGLRPVMVWIHGGALVSGESDDYDPQHLVARDVLVVTINYRLGALGFTAHPALTAESPRHASGNYGLLDQQAALRWVQRNILAFGGDPHRVTIFGESAGGLSVHSQLAAPSSKGLFQRAIVQSGAYQLAQPELAVAEAGGVAFASAVGCADQTAACLRGVSVEQILAQQNNQRGGASPVLDHAFLTRSIGEAFSTGAFNQVPVLEGANHDEWRLFVAISDLQQGGPTPLAAYPAAIAATLGIPVAATPPLLAAYPPDAGVDLALSALGTDAIFSCSARRAATLLADHVPTYVYEFADPNAPQRFLPPVGFPYAAAHASELQYLFELPAAVPVPPLDAAQRALAEDMADAWTQFARTGQPRAAGAPAWPRYRAESDVFQTLAPGGRAPTTAFAADHRCALWDSL